MQKAPLLVGVLLGGLSALPLAAASQTDGPDFSGGWARIGNLVETYEVIPGHAGAGPMLVDPLHPHIEGSTGQEVQWVSQLDNPILKSETRARLQVITEAEIRGVSHLKDEGVCQPSGVPMLLNRRGGAIQFLQTPTKLTILNARDNQVRSIYLNVPHSKDPGHTWYGESVGHFEGADTLVVDTIGQNDKTQVDRFGTPHSDRIHIVERYRLSPDRRTMDVQFTVEDPGAFTTPWSARVRFAVSPIEWDEQICAENNRFIGSVTFGGKTITSVPIPTDDSPDF